MKFGKVGQVGLVSAIALVVASAFTACSSTLTVGFLYVATNKTTTGQIEVYEVNSESGSLRTIPTSPFPSGGRNPVAEAVTPDSLFFYAVNEDDNNITHFGIGTDGKLYAQSTINTPGTFPMATAVNSAGTYLYVLDTLTPVAGCSLTNPCPSDIATYAITPSTSKNLPGSLGLAPACPTDTANPPSGTDCSTGHAVLNSNGLTYVALQATSTDTKTFLTPTAVRVSPSGNFVYATAYNASTSQGYLFAYSVGSAGALTPVTGSPFSVGSQPDAMITDSTGAYLFVADAGTGKIFTYTLNSSGIPTLQSTAQAGSRPSSLAIYSDKFLYVSNAGDSNVTAFGMSSGTLTRIEVSATDVNPVAIISDPRNFGFLYTVNFLGNSLSGLQIDTNDGTLINTQKTPYVSSAQPTAVVGVPHGGTTTKAAQ